MKSLLTPIVLVVLIGISCILLPQASIAGDHAVNVNAELEALIATDEAWSASVTNTNEFLSFFSDEALFMPAGAPLAQGDAIRVTWEQLVSNPGFALEWSATSAEIAKSGELGYTVGSFKLALDQDGVSMVTVGKYVTVWTKQDDGSWKVQVDCFNADGPPVAAGGP